MSRPKKHVPYDEDEFEPVRRRLSQMNLQERTYDPKDYKESDTTLADLPSEIHDIVSHYLDSAYADEYRKGTDLPKYKGNRTEDDLKAEFEHCLSHFPKKDTKQQKAAEAHFVLSFGNAITSDREEICSAAALFVADTITRYYRWIGRDVPHEKNTSYIKNRPFVACINKIIDVLPRHPARKLIILVLKSAFHYWNILDWIHFTENVNVLRIEPAETFDVSPFIWYIGKAIYLSDLLTGGPFGYSLTAVLNADVFQDATTSAEIYAEGHFISRIGAPPYSEGKAVHEKWKQIFNGMDKAFHVQRIERHNRREYDESAHNAAQEIYSE